MLKESEKRFSDGIIDLTTFFSSHVHYIMYTVAKNFVQNKIDYSV